MTLLFFILFFSCEKKLSEKNINLQNCNNYGIAYFWLKGSNNSNVEFLDSHFKDSTVLSYVLEIDLILDSTSVELLIFNGGFIENEKVPFANSNNSSDKSLDIIFKNQRFYRIQNILFKLKSYVQKNYNSQEIDFSFLEKVFGQKNNLWIAENDIEFSRKYSVVGLVVDIQSLRNEILMIPYKLQMLRKK